MSADSETAAGAAASPPPDAAAGDIPGGPASEILAWYDRHRRRLPWRAAPGARPEPYHVWLSEIMLQQTTVATVKGYFEAFLERWPHVGDLAAASLDDVLHAWQGLGYYARARNLHKCARAVAGDLDGVFPDTEAGLLGLPGVGPYTAAAIAAIAFDRPASPVDGNIERVVARLFAVETPLPAAKPELRSLAATLTPARRPGDYAQAVMDLGATVCAPRQPRCALCPWMARCRGRLSGMAAELPRRSPKAARPTRRGVVYWLVNGRGEVLLRRRPEEGLLGGLMEFPSGPWETATAGGQPVGRDAPAGCGWRALPGVVRHTFTHFHLELTVAAGRLDPGSPAPVAEVWPAGVWSAPDRLGDHALPTVMKKVAAHAARHLS